MGAFRNEQRRLTHRGRDFHFISYEAQAANPARKQQEMPDTWYLVSSNNRWPAIPLIEGQPEPELIAALALWLDTSVFADPLRPASA